MKVLVFTVLLASLGYANVHAQKNKEIKQEVEASCGQCQFGMAGGGCDLAIRVDGKKAYWVDGSDINDHGDAHSKVGFCNAIRKANVEGTVKGDKFKAEKFELLAVEKKPARMTDDVQSGGKKK